MKGVASEHILLAARELPRGCWSKRYELNHRSRGSTFFNTGAASDEKLYAVDNDFGRSVAADQICRGEA